MPIQSRKFATFGSLPVAFVRCCRAAIEASRACMRCKSARTEWSMRSARPYFASKARMLRALFVVEFERARLGTRVCFCARDLQRRRDGRTRRKYRAAIRFGFKRHVYFFVRP